MVGSHDLAGIAARSRRFFDFREFTVADGDKLTDGLADDYWSPLAWPGPSILGVRL